MAAEFDANWLAHLRGQFERARPILFTGAGFSLGVRNVRGEEMPSYSVLKERLWALCFPGASFEPTSSLQDLYDEALRRHKKDLKALLTGVLATDSNSIPDWHRVIFSMPWQRCYTLNVDDLEQSVARRYPVPRKIRSVSAVSLGGLPGGGDSAQYLDVVHLNGTIDDIPERVTFSVSQYAERLYRHEQWYINFAADLVTSPVIFIGTRLEEPPLWQHLVMRHGPGGRRLDELRQRSYLVVPELDRARQALLTEFNVVWVPLTGEEFAEKVLTQLEEAARVGHQHLASRPVKTEAGYSSLPEVAELATNPAEQSEFLIGSEPIWADIQSGRAIRRESDEEVWSAVTAASRDSRTPGIIVITGTAGAGKSTCLMRIALRLVAEGTRVAWVDRSSDVPPGQMRAAMRAEDGPAVLAIDDLDLYGNEASPLLRDITLGGRKPMALVAMRASKVERVLNPTILGDIPITEFSVPLLADADISALVDLLGRERRLGILTGKSRREQEQAFREQAGRQLLVAMIQATSGKRLEEKPYDELRELPPEAKLVYAFIAVATAFSFGLTKDEVLIASRDASNASLNALEQLVRRHVVVERSDGFIWARHRVIAEIIRDELQKSGEIRSAFSALALVGAAKASKTIRRSARPWRMLRVFLNHDMLARTTGVEFARSLYGSLEDLLAWDFHLWLQRGSLEVEFGDLKLAEHFLSTAVSLAQDDPYVETEWAYLLLRRAIEEPLNVEAQNWVKEATDSLENLTDRVGDPYPYHVLGSQGIAWSRAGLVAGSQEKERYLRKLIARIDEGCRKYPRAKELEKLHGDLKREYLSIALGSTRSAPQG